MQNPGASPCAKQSISQAASYHAHSFPRKMHVQGWNWTWEPIFIPWTFCSAFPNKKCFSLTSSISFLSGCHSCIPLESWPHTPILNNPFTSKYVCCHPKNPLQKMILLPLISVFKQKCKETWVNATMNSITTPPKIILKLYCHGLQPLHWNYPRVQRLLLKSQWKATSKANLLSMALNSLYMDPHLQQRLANWGKTEIHFPALCKISIHTDYINTQHHSKGLQNRWGFVGVHLYFAMGSCPCLSLVLRCSLSRSEFWRCNL